METLYLVVIVTFLAFLAGMYKVQEARLKGEFRVKLGSEFAFLSTKGYMQLIFFLFIIPLFFLLKWSISIVLLILGLSLLRFVPWVLVNIYRGKYQNTAHQASTNFTMLENFAGPLGALFVYGLYGYFVNPNISIFWYILTPFIGFFLLWALREKEENLSIEMLLIIFFQTILVSAETMIIVILKNFEIDFLQIPLFINFLSIDKMMIAFILVIGVSSLFSGLFFFKDIINDSNQGAGLDGFRIGFFYAIHDIFYFVSFVYFGPILIIARRGLLIPLQNLYINTKEGMSIFFLLRQPFREPLLTLKGGKDFIISFTDLVFNRVVKVIIG